MQGGNIFWNWIRKALPKVEREDKKCPIENDIEPIPGTFLYTIRPKAETLEKIAKDRRPIDSRRRQTVVFLGGIGSPIEVNLQLTCSLQSYVQATKDRSQPQFDFMTADHHSYSSIRKVIQDMTNILFEWPNELIFVGFSLGSGIATQIANRLPQQPAALFLVAPFPTLAEASPILKGSFLVPAVVGHSLDTISTLPQVESDVFIFAADEDELISIEDTKRLAQTPNVKGHYPFLKIVKGNHNDALDLPLIANFLLYWYDAKTSLNMRIR